MDCLQCHNRVGHPIPNPRHGMDSDLTNSRIDPTLPYVKREGMQILWTGYPDQETAFAEADKLSTFYELEYPAVAASQPTEIDQAIRQIKILYKLTATPEMKVTLRLVPGLHGAHGLPGLLPLPRRRPLPGEGRGGHLGGHPLHLRHVPHVAPDRRSGRQPAARASRRPRTTTPCGSSTTRTWPRPSTRAARTAASATPATTAPTATRRARSTWTTTRWRRTTPRSSASSGNQSCAYCHQPVYCARCHAEPVLPVTTITDVPHPSAAPEGVRWPLIADRTGKRVRSRRCRRGDRCGSAERGD